MQPRNRIGTMLAFSIVSVMLIFDGIQMLLALIILIGGILASFVSLLGGLTSWFWFKLNDVSILEGSGAKIAIYAGSFITEAVPYLNMLPALTIAAVLTIAIVRWEDRAYNREHGFTV